MALRINIVRHQAGEVWLDAPYNNVIQKLLNSWPGARRCAKTGLVILDRGLLGQFVKCCKRSGWVLSSYTPLYPPPLETHPDLRSYQFKAVKKILRDGAGILAFDMGLGKTATAIEVCKQVAAKRVLVVCPAMVRLVWRDQLTKWWPELEGVHIITKGSDIGSYQPVGLTVISYALLHKLPRQLWHVIIFDELHYIKNNDKQRSRAAARQVEYNRDKVLLGLTGTPITNLPDDLYNQLDLIFPARFGKLWAFRGRYCKIEHTDYGKKVGGLRQRHARELEVRLNAALCRVTTQRVAHLLPVLSMETIRLFPKRATVDQLLAGEVDPGHYDDIVQLAQDVARDNSHVAVVTHYIQTAADLARLLGSNVFLATGKSNTTERYKIIEDAKACPRAFLVASMHSILTGLDLTQFNRIMLVELYPSPGDMAQLIKRFHRPNSSKPVKFYTVVVEGTVSEKIADVLSRKVVDNSLVISPGVAEVAMGDLAPVEMSDEEFEREMLQLAASLTELGREGESYE